MSLPDDDEATRPGVYARLAQQSEVRRTVLTPGRWVRWAGWGIVLALAGGVVLAAIEAHPW